jgi:adenine specific DNA methylase Mod
MTFQKKSVAVEGVLGTAAAELKKGAAAVLAAVAQVEGLNEKAEGLQLTIASNEDRIKYLEVEYSELKRQKDVQLALDIKANKDKAVAEVLTSNAMVAIAQVDLDKLKKDFTDLKEAFEDKVDEAVKKVAGAMAGNYENKAKLMDAEFKAKEAGNIASIESLTRQVSAMQAENTRLYAAIDAEREASIKRAQASNPTINVPSYGGK